jgi:hypothetical protein
MVTDNELLALLRGLEESLLQPAVRASAQAVSRLLADEFVEFGASGRVYDKAQTVAALAEEQKLGPVVPPIASGFRMSLLAEGVALVTYQTERRPADGPITRSRRSSIWKQKEGRWQMVFHQGTPVPPEAMEEWR